MRIGTTSRFRGNELNGSAMTSKPEGLPQSVKRNAAVPERLWVRYTIS